MIDIQQNILNYITTNLAEYKTWIEDKYSTEGYTLSALNHTGIFDTLDCQMPALIVTDAGKDGGDPVRINNTCVRDSNLEIYIIDYSVDQRQAELNILLYGEILEQLFVDFYNDDTKRINKVRSIELGTWTPFDISVERDSNVVDNFKVGRLLITAKSQIYGRG